MVLQTVKKLLTNNAKPNNNKSCIIWQNKQNRELQKCFVPSLEKKEELQCTSFNNQQLSVLILGFEILLA